MCYVTNLDHNTDACKSARPKTYHNITFTWLEQARPSTKYRDIIGAHCRTSYSIIVIVYRYNGHITGTNMNVRCSNVFILCHFMYCSLHDDRRLLYWQVLVPDGSGRTPEVEVEVVFVRHYLPHKCWTVHIKKTHYNVRVVVLQVAPLSFWVSNLEAGGCMSLIMYSWLRTMYPGIAHSITDQFITCITITWGKWNGWHFQHTLQIKRSSSVICPTCSYALRVAHQQLLSGHQPDS